MKRMMLILLVLALLPVSALADKARGIQTKEDERWHSEHLASHIGDTTCRGIVNYLKVRETPESTRINGHLEQADRFLLLDVQGNRALITVQSAADTSPDSYAGLTGWVNASYIDCACSEALYAGWNAVDSYTEVIRLLERAGREGWSPEEYAAVGLDSDIFQMDLTSYAPLGFALRDLDGDGSLELLIGEQRPDRYEGACRLCLVYTMQAGHVSLVMMGRVRSGIGLRADGTIYLSGSNGALDHIYEVHGLQNGRMVCLEGVRKLWESEHDCSYYAYSDIMAETPISEAEGEARIERYCGLLAMTYAPFEEWPE